MNKYRPHLWLLPEDDANIAIANGFVLHDRVASRMVQTMNPVNGWPHFHRVFEQEYEPLLRRYGAGHLLMLVDFDGVAERRSELEKFVPEELRPRIFIMGSKITPELLRREVGMSFEVLGKRLAIECDKPDGLWNHEHLIHNRPELERLIAVVKPFLFQY